MLREVPQFAAAGGIVAADKEGDDPRARLSGQMLRCACAYDLLTARDNMSSDLAVEMLRTAPGYVYEPRVIDTLERAVRKRSRSA